MGDRTNEIERHIEEQRHALSENVSELREKVKSAVDWRAQFEERPLAMMGLAFGGGMLLAALLPGISRSNGKRHSRTLQRISDNEGNFSPVSSSYNPEILRPAKKSEAWQKASETLNGVKGALLAVAATKVSHYLEELVPGFNEQYRKSERRTM
jgi:hypothetical protein